MGARRVPLLVVAHQPAPLRPVAKTNGAPTSAHELHFDTGLPCETG
jgi:hypothetical protein